MRELLYEVSAQGLERGGRADLLLLLLVISALSCAPLFMAKPVT